MSTSDNDTVIMYVLLPFFCLHPKKRRKKKIREELRNEMSYKNAIPIWDHPSQQKYLHINNNNINNNNNLFY